LHGSESRDLLHPARSNRLIEKGSRSSTARAA